MDNYNKILAKEAIKHIVPERIYTKNDIVKERLIPWSRHEQTVRRILDRGVLKSKFTLGVNRANNKWEIKGSDITEYLKTYSGLK